MLVLIGEATVRVSRMERTRKVRKLKRVRELLVSEERRGGRNILLALCLVVRCGSDNEDCFVLQRDNVCNGSVVDVETLTDCSVESYRRERSALWRIL